MGPRGIWIVLCFLHRASTLNEYLVIDHGSGFIKIGTSAQPNSPRLVVPNVVGRNESVTLYGAEALNGDNLSLEYPTQSGTVKDWSDTTTMWYKALHDRLGLSLNSHPVFVTMPTETGHQLYREEITRALQTRLGVPAVEVQNDAELALKSRGLDTGLVIQSGSDLTSAVAVVDGRVQADTYRWSAMAGRKADQYLSDLLDLRGISDSAERAEQLQNIKKEMCYVAQDAEAEKTKDVRMAYNLNVNHTIFLDNERFLVGEAFFQPELAGMDSVGIHVLAHRALQASNPAMQQELLANVMLAGGSTMLSGFTNRLRQELETLCKQDLQIHASMERHYAVWVGAALQARQLLLQDSLS